MEYSPQSNVGGLVAEFVCFMHAFDAAQLTEDEIAIAWDVYLKHLHHSRRTIMRKIGQAFHESRTMHQNCVPGLN